MIIETPAGLAAYAGLNPLLLEVATFIATHDLSALPDGKHVIIPEEAWVNIQSIKPKDKADAKIETHNKMVDVQIPLDAPETMGYKPRASMEECPYDEDKDITFHPGLADTYFTLMPGQCAVFFPSDAHAPGITDKPLRKAVFKIKNL